MIVNCLQIVFVIVLIAGQTLAATTTEAQPISTTEAQPISTTEAQPISTVTTATAAVTVAAAQPTSALPAVQGLKVSNSSTTGLTLTWTKPAGDGHVYNVSYEREDGPTHSNSTEEETFEFSALEPGYNYTFTITYEVNNNTGVSPAAWITFVLAPEKPKNISVLHHETALDLTWENPVGKVSQYSVSLNNTVKGSPTTEMLEVPGLLPGTIYKISISSVSNGKESQAEVVHAATMFAAPQNLTVNDAARGTTEVGVTWDPFGGFDEFDLYCNRTVDAAPKTVKTPSGECTDLTPGTTFTVFVITKGNMILNGESTKKSSEPSDTLKSITVPLPPKTFTATAANSSSIHLSWTKDEGNLGNWVLKMDPAEGSTEFPLSLGNTETTHSIDGLTPGRLFNFSMLAQSVDPVTNATFDSAVIFVDERTYPEAPKNITILGTSQSSLEVAWVKPNGDVSFYNVTVSPSDRNSSWEPAVSATGTSANLKDLKPAGLKWAVKVTTVSGGKESKSSLDIEAFTYPLPLLSLTIDAVITTNATLTWSHDDNDKAESLLLRWDPQTSSGQTFPSTSASQVITGLTPGQSYVFYMKAKSGQWNSTEISNATTMVPVSPSNLVATHKTAHHLEISWNLTEGLYDSFTARINPGPTNGSATIETNTTDAEFINLLPGTEYNISVFTKAGDRESVTVRQFFNTSETQPGPPRNLTVVEPVNSRFFTVKWEEPLKKNGWIKRYVLSVESSSGGGFSLNTSNNKTTERKKTITGLTPVTEYTISVTAVNGAGAGQTSETITVTTGEAVSGVVSNFTVSKDTAFSVMVSWGHPLVPHGTILHYVLEVSLSAEDAQCQQVVLFNCSDCPANETDAVLKKVDTPCYPRNEFRVKGVKYQEKTSVNYTVTSLLPFTEYSFTVYPVSRPGLGNMTSATETTEEYYPGMVSSIKFTDISTTAFVVSWSAPKEPNGIITKYNISAQDSSTGDTKYFSTNSTEKLIDNRKIFITYNVKVMAYTKIGPGNWSEERLVKTAEDAPTEVQNLILEVRSSSSLALSWEQPAQLNGILRIYTIIYIYNNGTEDITETKDVSNTTTNHILEGLEKWTVYNVSVAAVTVKRGPLRFVVERTDEDVPDGPPRMVEAVNETSTSFSVSWQPPETPNGFITKYTVEYKDVKEGTKRSKETTDNSTSLVIDGLRSYKLYNISVCANTRKGQGPCSVAKTWQTDQDKPSPPHSVEVTNASSTYFIIRWESPVTPNGIILEYEVITTMLADGTETKDTTNEREISITGLTPYNNYSIQVRGRTVKGYGNLSDVIYEVTSEDQPSPPHSVDVTNASSTYFIIRWKSPVTPNGIILEYEVIATMLANGTETKDTTNETEISITGLTPYNNYSIQVRGRTVKGYGNWSDVIYEVTSEDLPGEPENLRKEDVQPYSLVLKWSAPRRPNGVVIKYTIMYGMMNDFNSTVSANGTDTSIRIDSLLACRQYNFKVAAHTRVGRGNFSEVFSVLTEHNIPSKPYDLDLKPLSSTSLKLTWMKPNETCPATYEINLWQHSLRGDKKLEVRPEFKIFDDGSLTRPRANSIEIDKLHAYTSYSVEIKVEISDKENVSDRTPKVRTKEGRAGQVDYFAVNAYYTHVKAEWKHPKDKNGLITFYMIIWKVEGLNKEYNKSFPAIETSANITENIWSETKYTFTIQAQNGAGLGEVYKVDNVETKSGPAVPAVNNSTVMTRAVVKDTAGVPVDKWRQFAINLEDQLFDMTNGEVTQIGVFVATAAKKEDIPDKLQVEEYVFHGWRDTLDADGNPKGTYYMIKPMEKPPSSWKKVIPSRKRRAVGANIVIIGENTAGCPRGSGEQKYCNAPLQPETEYCVAVGAYTKWGFTRTPCAEFRTGAVPFPLIPVIVGVACALLVIIIVIIIVIILKRKRGKRGGNRKPNASEMIEMGTRSPLEGEDNAAFVITDEYGDEVSVAKPTPMNVRSFPAIVSQMHHEDDKIFKWQYKLLEKVSPVHTIERAVQNEAIKAKNRYINILPFDHTLVHLNIPEGEESVPAAGYTNASYIPGNNHRREYIACQGPMNRTIDDFWRMVWEQNVSTIIMLTKCVESGKEKCAQYWPSDQQPVFRGDLEVQLLSESFLDDYIYVIRIVELSDLLSEKTRKVTQFHFLSWPDWGKPDSASYLLRFLDVVQSHQRTSDIGPKLVHCSAGIGRTGTYITVERLLEQITRQPKISVFDTILDLRESRKGMVQGVKQYTYIHECLKDAIEQRLARKQIQTSPPAKSTQNGNMRC